MKVEDIKNLEDMYSYVKELDIRVSCIELKKNIKCKIKEQELSKSKNSFIANMKDKMVKK
jgi:hypothetical protein